jgi:hypothetical protein
MMAIKPIFSRFNYEANRWEFLLSDDDFRKVQQSYACGECLEDFQGEFRLRCPVCGHSTAGGDRVLFDVPEEWK